MQAIYECKTRRLPRVKFPEFFCFNEKHWGNEKESLKIIGDIIASYIAKEGKTVQSQPTCNTNHGRFQGTDDLSRFEEIRRIQWRRGVVVVTTAQLHSAKPGLRFCAGSGPARGVSEIRDGEDL